MKFKVNSFLKSLCIKSFWSNLYLGGEVAYFSERSSRRFSSSVGFYWKHFPLLSVLYLPRHDSVFKVISLLAVRFIPILFCVAVNRLVPNWSHFLESFVWKKVGRF